MLNMIAELGRQQAEVVRLRRDRRRLEMEVDVLRRATAYFAKAAAPK